MSSQLTNNNYTTVLESLNPYISRQLNNMNLAQEMKKERKDWTRLYHKMLKELETMIDVQKMVKDIKKLTEEVNTMLTEVEGTILAASINNWMVNTTNIAGISEDLQYIVQSNMEDQVFQTQMMLADELDAYKGKGNRYVNENIREIQELYANEEQKEKNKGKVKDEEVILIKPYEVSESSSTKSSSFVDEEVDNLLKYMKFVKSPTQTRIFQPLPHYQSLWSRGEQDPDFWKEVVTTLVDNKYNTETVRNRYPIRMFQEGPPHKPFFIATENRGQVIIGPNKKTVATYVVGELEVLIWFMRTWMLKRGYCYNWYLKDVA